jgi:hypothetical protein
MNTIASAFLGPGCFRRLVIRPLSLAWNQPEVLLRLQRLMQTTLLTRQEIRRSQARALPKPQARRLSTEVLISALGAWFTAPANLLASVIRNTAVRSRRGARDTLWIEQHDLVDCCWPARTLRGAQAVTYAGPRSQRCDPPFVVRSDQMREQTALSGRQQ